MCWLRVLLHICVLRLVTMFQNIGGIQKNSVQNWFPGEYVGREEGTRNLFFNVCTSRFGHFLCCTGFIYARLMRLSIKLSLSLSLSLKRRWVAVRNEHAVVVCALSVDVADRASVVFK